MIIVPIKRLIDKATSQTGTSSIPTRRSITIGEKNGINDVMVTRLDGGDVSPDIAIRNATTSKRINGVTAWFASSDLFTKEPNMAANVAYNKYPNKKNTIP